MNKLKKVNINARGIEYCLLDNGKVINIRTMGSDAVKYSIGDDDLISNICIPFHIILGETLKIEDKKYFTEKRTTSCYVDFDDLKKQIWDESLVHNGKLCIDLNDHSVISSDYQIIPEEKFKELKKTMINEYFES